jgi:uncharacterized protein YoxC
MMNMDFETLKPLLVQYLKSASTTIASHAERIEKLTADVNVHDEDLKGCAEKMAEVVNAVNELKATQQQLITTLKQAWDRTNEIAELANRHTLLVMEMWQHLGMPVSADGSPMVGGTGPTVQ